MAHIHSVISEVPQYNISQMEFYDHVAPKINPRLHNIFKKILNGSQIRKRHFSIGLDQMTGLTEQKQVGDKFSIWKETTMEFWTRQANDIIKKAGLRPDEIDGICTSTTSGFITPDPAVLIQHELGLRGDIIRMPLFGFGCSGGQAAIHRVDEYLTAFPDRAFLVFVGEALSTQYEEAQSVSTLVSNSIFGDGYATMLMVGKEHRLASKSQIEIMNIKSIIFPNCDFAIGQWMTDEGIHTHLDAKLPRLVKSSIKAPLDAMFNEAGVESSDVDYWICHAGGPKVMEVFAETMHLGDDALHDTMETYRNYGNQSSVSVVTALDRILSNNTEAGLGYMMALGPGIHMEYSLCKVTPRPKSEKMTHAKSRIEETIEI